MIHISKKPFLKGSPVMRGLLKKQANVKTICRDKTPAYLNYKTKFIFFRLHSDFLPQKNDKALMHLRLHSPPLCEG
jgi:hypothetical protein